MKTGLAELRVVVEEWCLLQRHSIILLPEIAEETDRAIICRLRGATDAIWVSMEQFQITAGIDHEGQTWDLLWSDHAAAQMAVEGWVCSVCMAETGGSVIYQSPADLYRRHLLDGLGRWISETLEPAEQVALHRQRDFTWVKLLTRGEGAGGADTVLAIRR